MKWWARCYAVKFNNGRIIDYFDYGTEEKPFIALYLRKDYRMKWDKRKPHGRSIRRSF